MSLLDRAPAATAPSGEAGDGIDATSTTTGPGPSKRAIALHAGLAFVVVTIMALAMHSSVPAISDEGSALAQAALIRDGRVGTPLPVPAADPQGRFAPMENSTVVDGTEYPYTKHFALPGAVALAERAFGSAGGVLMSAWSVWLSGLAAAMVAWRVDRRSTLVALWAVPFLSPLVFDANLVMSSGFTAAALGALVATVLAVRERPGWWRLLPVVPLAVAATAFRSEGFLGVAAVAAFAVGEPLVRRLLTRRWADGALRSVVVGSLAGAAGLVAYRVDALVARHITGYSATGFTTVGAEFDPFLGRLSAAWVSLARPNESGAPVLTTLAAMGVLVLLVVAVVVLRRGSDTRRVPLLLVGAACCAVVLAFGPTALITGLIAAVPLAVLPLLLLRRRDLAGDAVRGCLGVCTLTALAVVATSYSEGGGAEWGGRYYHQLLPLLVPVALLGLRQGRERLSTRDAMVATVAVAVVAAGPSVLALRRVADLHEASAMTVQVVEQQIEAAGPADDGGPIVVVSTRPTFGRFAWDRIDRMRLLSVTDADMLGQALDGVADAGVTRVLAVTGDDEDPPGRSDGGWRSTGRRDIGGWRFTELVRDPAG